LPGVLRPSGLDAGFLYELASNFLLTRVSQLRLGGSVMRWLAARASAMAWSSCLSGSWSIRYTPGVVSLSLTLASSSSSCSLGGRARRCSRRSRWMVVASRPTDEALNVYSSTRMRLRRRRWARPMACHGSSTTVAGW
jgi:hypothetical protein